jgi:hypothetical protein
MNCRHCEKALGALDAQFVFENGGGERFRAHPPCAKQFGDRLVAIDKSVTALQKGGRHEKG